MQPTAAPTSPLAIVTDLPLSSASTAARRSVFFSMRLAKLTSNLPLVSGVVFFHSPSKALRAAATAISTSFSVASWTEVMTSSVEGLMVSKVLPSTPLTHSLLMNLLMTEVSFLRYSCAYTAHLELATGMENLQLNCGRTYNPVGCVYSPVCGVLS